MSQTFQKIEPSSWERDPFTAIGKDWMLITAGTPEDFNTMTASWGMLGVLWNKPTAACFVRHSRHTFGYMEKSDCFTLSFFEGTQREALNYCGTYSGRDGDKAAAAGLHPIALEGSTTFSEAKLVMVCKKLYSSDISPEQLPEEIRSAFYSGDSPHKLFFGEILSCYRVLP